MAQHLVNPEITKYWNFPRSPVVPTLFLMLTVSPLGRWKATVSSPLEYLYEAWDDEDMAAEEVVPVSS